MYLLHTGQEIDIYNESSFNGLVLRLENIEVGLPMARRIGTNAESLFPSSVHDFPSELWEQIVYLIELR